VRPVGVLLMEDDKGGDEKLITVPVDSTFPYYSEVADTADLPPIVAQQIEHFFTHYKDLEPGKWSKMNGWGDRSVAELPVLCAGALVCSPKRSLALCLIGGLAGYAGGAGVASLRA